jgi:hypothetical protein
MSDTNLNSDEMAGSTADQYCSISESMKLVIQPFDGNKMKLKEFIENVCTLSSWLDLNSMACC